jgi:carbon monoxide dehydrogenase subunit G
MQVSASYRFDGPSSEVWAVLVDPDAVAGCVPGCESFESLGGDKYKATMAIGIASVKGRYEGTVAILDQEPGSSFRLVLEGSSAVGFIRGEGFVSVVEKQGKTQVGVSGDAEVGGVIGRVGHRILGRASKLLMDEYFKCMRKKVASARVRS